MNAPEPAPGSDATAPESVARPAGLVALATGGSRVGGLLREAIFAALIGAGGVASAFVLAFRIPNLLRDFFAEGALSSAFVPTFARAREEGGEARAFLLARRVMGTLLVVTGLVAVLGILFAPQVVAVVAPEARPEVRDLTIRLTRVMFPFLPLVALAAVAMGVLNTHRRYFVPALAPAFFNAVAILGGGLMLLLEWDRPEKLETAVTVWAALVVVGGGAQLLVQWPLLRRVGWRGGPKPDLRLRDPALRTIVRRMGPVIIALAGVNVMLVIVTALSSRGVEWPARLNFAFRLVHLPIGLIGVAVGTVVLAAGSRRAAAGDAEGVDALVRDGLRLNWFLALPAAVGLAVFAEPLLRLVYERGRFTADDTVAVAAALRGYAPGIVFYAGVKAAAPLFLARGDTRTPMFCSLAGIAVTIAAAFLLVGPLEWPGLALAVAAGSTTNYLLLRVFGRRAYGAASAPPAAFLGRVVLAAAVMGGLAYGARPWLVGDGAVSSGWLHAFLTLGLITALAAVYFVVGRALGVPEARTLLGRIPGLGRR